VRLLRERGGMHLRVCVCRARTTLRVSSQKAATRSLRRYAITPVCISHLLQNAAYAWSSSCPQSHLLFRRKGSSRGRSGSRVGKLLREHPPTKVARRVVWLSRRVEDAAALEGGGKVVRAQKAEELRDGGRADECVSVEEDRLRKRRLVVRAQLLDARVVVDRLAAAHRECGDVVHAWSGAISDRSRLDLGPISAESRPDRD